MPRAESSSLGHIPCKAAEIGLPARVPWTGRWSGACYESRVVRWSPTFAARIRCFVPGGRARVAGACSACFAVAIAASLTRPAPSDEGPSGSAPVSSALGGERERAEPATLGVGPTRMNGMTSDADANADAGFESEADPSGAAAMADRSQGIPSAAAAGRAQTPRGSNWPKVVAPLPGQPIDFDAHRLRPQTGPSGNTRTRSRARTLGKARRPTRERAGASAGPRSRGLTLELPAEGPLAIRNLGMSAQREYRLLISGPGHRRVASDEPGKDLSKAYHLVRFRPGETSSLLVLAVAPGWELAQTRSNARGATLRFARTRGR